MLSGGELLKLGGDELLDGACENARDIVRKNGVRNARWHERQGEREEKLNNILPKNCKSCRSGNNLSYERRRRVVDRS